ncbi:MAG: LysR substrate-binding domain-containing protein [Stappiaceae bacterium]
MITLRQMKFLVALADELNFSRAADVCHVTQPTLSAGLRELEEELGLALAERTKRSVIMTPEGAEITERARKVLAEVKDISDWARRSTDLFSQTLRLGTIPTIGPFILPKALRLLRQEIPDLRLYLREELTEQLLPKLHTGELDAILIAQPFEIGQVESELLFEDNYQVAAPKNHALGSLEWVGGQNIRDQQLLLLERGHCLQRHALSAFPEVDVQHSESFAATSLNTLVSMVEEGLGITLLPQMAIDAGFGAGYDVLLLPIRNARPRRVILAWRPTSAHAEEFHKLAHVLRQAREALAA